MIAGLPGTGIGGLYYLLLVVLMPLRELYFWICGRSSRPRWRVISGIVLLSAVMIGAMQVQAGFIIWAFKELERHHLISASALQLIVHATYVPMLVATWLTVVVLAALMVGAYLLRLITGGRGSHRHAANRITAKPETTSPAQNLSCSADMATAEGNG